MSLIKKLKEMDKDDWRYLWEDYKKKIIMYGFFGIIAFIILIVCIVTAIKSLRKPPEVEIIEDEIYVGGIDIDQTTEDLEREFEEALNRNYGPKWDAVNFHASGYYFEAKGADGKLYSIAYREENTINQMRKIKGNYILRGNVAPIDEGTKQFLIENMPTKGKILEELAGHEEYMEYFVVALGEAKTAANCGPCVTDDYILEVLGEDYLNAIYEDAYARFEELIKKNFPEEYEIAMRPLENNVDVSNFYQMDGEWTICKLDGTPLYKFDVANFTVFYKDYWANYIKDPTDVYWTEGKNVRTSDLNRGEFYESVQDVPFTIENSEGDFVYVWYVDRSYETTKIWLWGGNAVWDDYYIEDSPVVTKTEIPAGTLCFAIYDATNVNQHFDIADEGEHTIFLKDHISTVDPFVIPDGTYYIQNNTEFDVKVILNDPEDEETLFGNKEEAERVTEEIEDEDSYDYDYSYNENDKRYAITEHLRPGQKIFIDYYSIRVGKVLPEN